VKTRINKILEHLNKGVHEREEVIAVSLLAALADQNIFLLGPPGTAKSLISRRLSHAFETESYFEYLMQRFSTPEEVFGPVSISELKKDNYIRKTEGFLPKSDFAFLDEIWKSSPAILNTLLTIINEKIFRNGQNIEKVPLKVLVSASNETPPENQGLEALYDRFLVRMHVPPLGEKNSFESLLQSNPTKEQIDLPSEILITHDEWELWQLKIEEIKLSSETLNVIHDIRLTFSEKGDDLDIYVSDRRWQRASMLLKSAAFFCSRKETNLVDTLLLRHCLWTTNDNRQEVIKIVEDAVRNCGFETGFNLHGIDEEKESLEKEIQKELYHSIDVYETVKLSDNNQYFKCTKEYEINGHYSNNKKGVTFYIPANQMKNNDEFNPIDEQGNELKWIKCNFDNQGVCHIEIERNENPRRGNWQGVPDFSPSILFHKGDKKTDVNTRLVASLRKEVVELAEKFESIINDIDNKLVEFKDELDTPFVLGKTRDIALESISNQLRDMKLRHKDCERLKSLIG
jgi:MoxR-like ATPase